MPQVRMKVCWPDETTTSHISPSTIIQSYFQSNDELPLADFVVQSQKAFEHASERVKERFGFHCSQASDSLSEIQRLAESQTSGTVRVVDLEVIQ
ncbi:MAG: MSMEG_0570 family nitrogen starvation response protein [Planctomycetota bacterium]